MQGQVVVNAVGHVFAGQRAHGMFTKDRYFFSDAHGKATHGNDVSIFAKQGRVECAVVRNDHRLGDAQFKPYDGHDCAILHDRELITVFSFAALEALLLIPKTARFQKPRNVFEKADRQKGLGH